MAFTATELIAAVKSLASIPSSQNLFSTEDFLRFANRSLSLKLTPLIKSVREEYRVTEFDHTIVAGQKAYRIPRFAVVDALRDVKLVTANSEESLPRLEPEFVNSEQHGFFIKANKVMLAFTPTGNEGTLRLSYERRPGRLVETSACARITEITGSQVTVDFVPATFATDVTVDLIEANPGFDWLATDQAITGVSGLTITFASLPSELAVGDYIALAGESPVIQLPVELHPLLEQHVSVQCLDAQGKNSKKMSEDYVQMEQDALKLLTPRVTGEPKKIISPNSILSHFRRC